MAPAIDQLIKVRQDKLEELVKLGLDPFTIKFEKEKSISECVELMDQTVTTAGRLMSLRGHGAIAFADLVDQSGKIQLLFKKDDLPDVDKQIVPLLDIGDIIGVTGLVFKTNSGETTIHVNKLVLLTKSLHPLPSVWYGLTDTEQRYRERYVDLLLNPEVRNVFNTRTKLVSYLRKYLDKKGFFEVETPVLQPLYGGATAKPFKTFHNSLKTDFYLRISDELYLKRLIVGGYDKVYEIAKDFRNEGIDRQHNPEFSMLEFYWAYADYNDLMDMTEKMLSSAVKEITGSYKLTFQGQEIDFKPPWPRTTYRDLILRDTGIDIDIITQESALRQAMIDNGLKVDLKGVAGFGNILDSLYKVYCRPNLVGPMYVIDHPSSLMPLAKRLPKDQTKIASLQLLICSFEIVKAYSELNDPRDQRARWEDEKKNSEAGFEEAQQLDEDYIRALEYGMPPTAGWGMGIDRFTAIITDQPSLKDTILFPTLKPEVFETKKK